MLPASCCRQLVAGSWEYVLSASYMQVYYMPVSNMPTRMWGYMPGICLPGAWLPAPGGLDLGVWDLAAGGLDPGIWEAGSGDVLCSPGGSLLDGEPRHTTRDVRVKRGRREGRGR